MLELIVKHCGGSEYERSITYFDVNFIICLLIYFISKLLVNNHIEKTYPRFLLKSIAKLKPLNDMCFLWLAR